MCNIMAFQPKAKIPYEKLENCVFNNPHGFGLILKDRGRIQVIKECSEKGNDPEKIAKLLDDNDDINRYLHVRWRTQGPINLENVHPFPVYNSNKREVYFMHNGTLNNYNGTDDDSDSKRFAENFLSPFFLRYNGEHGKADLDDPLFKFILDKVWTPTSRGLLISSDQDDLQIGFGWKEFEDEEKHKWVASNDHYFSNVIRGPVFDQRKKEREEKENKERNKHVYAGFSDLNTLGNERRANDNNSHRPYAISDLAKAAMVDEDISKRLAKIFDSSNFYEDKCLNSLCWLSDYELDRFIQERSHEEITWLFTWITQKLHDQSQEIEVLEHKHQKATKMIATLQYNLEECNSKNKKK